MWFLQLVILIKSVSIAYPHTFNTYKSLTSLNNGSIATTKPVVRKAYQMRKFSNSSAEFFLAMLKNSLKGNEVCDLSLKKGGKKKIVYLISNTKTVENVCQALHMCRTIYRNKFGYYAKPLLIRKYDPDASDFNTQFMISKSLRGVPGKRTVYSKMRLLTENGLHEGLSLYLQTVLTRDYKDMSILLGLSQKAADQCIENSIPPEIVILYGFHLTLKLKKLFQF